MGIYIIIALSNLATMLLTAWLLDRKEKGLSPIPSRSPKVEADSPDPEPTYTKGRNIL